MLAWRSAGVKLDDVFILASDLASALTSGLGSTLASGLAAFMVRIMVLGFTEIYPIDKTFTELNQFFTTFLHPAGKYVRKPLLDP